LVKSQCSWDWFNTHALSTRGKNINNYLSNMPSKRSWDTNNYPYNSPLTITTDNCVTTLQSFFK
jgi:hypothetical protein